MTFHMDLPRRIDAALATEIEKEAAFVSPYLANLSVGTDYERIAVESTDPGRDDEVRDKLDRFLASMLQQVTGFETKTFVQTERSDQGPYETDVHRKLVERGWIHDYNRGRAALSGPALALARYIDLEASAMYHKTFAAEEREFPALIDSDLLWRCGYFDSHPNAVCFVGHVVEDFDAIESFRASNAGSECAQLPAHEHVNIPGMCLNPAACFPSYPTLKGRDFAQGGYAMTWRGRVFRFESRNVAGLDRMWEFNVREIVFAGGDDYVTDSRRKALPLIEQLAQGLDLDCSIETAADPFFATVAAAKTFWQRAQEVKNEILLPVGLRPDGTMRRMACGSINLHGRFFGDRFEFSAEGQPASTACVGLGIERWVLAAFTQHGFDPARWPQPVRAEIFG